MKKRWGPEHPDTALSLNNLAALLSNKGNTAAAEPLYRRALAIYEKVLGPEHPKTALSLNNLAALLSTKGDTAAAEPLYRRALAIDEKTLGPEHPDTASSLNNLASLLLDKGERTDPLRLARQAAKAGWPRRDVYLSALDANRTTNPDVLLESFQAIQSISSSEAGKALTNLTARFTAGDDAIAVIVREEQDTSSELAALDKALLVELGKFPNERNDQRIQTLRNRVGDLKKRLANIRNRLERDFPDYVELAKPKPLGLSDTQSLLHADEALIVIDTVPNSGLNFVWAVTADSGEWTKLNASQNEIDKLVTDLLTDLNPENQTTIDTAKAHRLYELTLAKMERIFGEKKHLIFVLNGPLTSLPPQVLVTSNPADKAMQDVDWLIKRHAITILPTVSSLKLLRENAGTAPAPKPCVGMLILTILSMTMQAICRWPPAVSAMYLVAVLLM